MSVKFFNGSSKKRLSTLVVGSYALFSTLSFGQINRAYDLRLPLDIPIYLSGNFAELRSNHFHTGVDFKTQGVTGIPIKSVADGYVSRISVSPTGYGRALYIDHPQLGITTVYAHLSSYTTRIDTVIKRYQYGAQQFKMDRTFKEGAIPVQRGEVIALSGNSGSSGGPHLHFEIRETESEHPINALYSYKDRVVDTRPPRANYIALYPIDGVVNGADTALKRFNVRGGRVEGGISAWGEVAFGINAYDYMDGVHNTFGVYTIKLVVDDKVIYSTKLDETSFDEGRYINSFIDYSYLKRAKSYLMKSYIEPGNQLTHLYQEVDEQGTVVIDEEREYPCAYILSDIHGNTTHLPFTIRGERSEWSSEPLHPSPNLLYYHLPHTLQREGMTLDIAAGSLYRNLNFVYAATPSQRYFTPIHQLASATVPLHKAATLTLEIAKDTLANKQQYYLAEITPRGEIAHLGSYHNGEYTTAISTFGDYAIAADKLSPSLRAITPTNWNRRGEILLHITDQQSGIESYHGEVDGEFILLEYDAKSGYLRYKIDREHFPSHKRHTLQVSVTDRCGNKRVQSFSF